MKKIILLFLTIILVAIAYADISYCPGTVLSDSFKYFYLHFIFTSFALQVGKLASASLLFS